ncbi:MAG: hypothetical protein WEF86_08085 [Gemmatimonadota bacterium]
MRSLEEVVRELRAFAGAPHKSLSIYMTLGPRGAGTNDRAQLMELLRPLRGTTDDPPSFEAAVAVAETSLGRLRPRPWAVAVFTCPARGLDIIVPLRTPVESSAHWQEELHLAPLLAVLDEHEPMLVMLLDTRRARLFRVFMREIEEIETLRRSPSRRNPRGNSPGRARHGRSGMPTGMGYDTGIEGHEDEGVRKHVDGAIAMLKRADPTEAIGRILVGGPVEAVSRFLDRLPAAVRSRVAAASNLPVNSSPAEVLTHMAEQEAGLERASELELIEELIEGFGHSCIGSAAVSEAVADGKVQTLVYASGATVTGFECSACRWIMPADSSAAPERGCPRCGTPMRHDDDLVAVMVRRVMSLGGTVEELRGAGADRLRAFEGVGALLRYVPASPAAAGP